MSKAISTLNYDLRVNGIHKFYGSFTEVTYYFLLFFFLSTIHFSTKISDPKVSCTPTYELKIELIWYIKK